MRKFIHGIAILSICALSACTTSGAFLALNQTQVNLDQANYAITATGVSGESKAAYILGLSYSTSIMANTIAIARISGSGSLYSEALNDLWENYEKDNGAIDGKRLALVNVRYDTNILNLILYNKVKVAVRADVVEFTD